MSRDIISLVICRQLWMLAFVSLFLAASARGDEPGLAFFENQVRPLLLKNCINCHGPKKQSGSLRLDSRAEMIRGGDRGPAILLTDTAKSPLLVAIAHSSELRMPPKTKLTPDQIAIFTRWVVMGAPWSEEKQIAAALRSGPITERDRQFWSLQPIRKSPPPAIADTSWPKTDIDRFILARLEAKALKPAAMADKRTLIRRATFDLIGLPPTPEEVDQFLKDSSEKAFDKVIDRLLASPHYGERWGRHWLDVVRYADTAGETADYPSPEAYRYRNYVIESFNADKPYDEFLREQIAGDLLAVKGPREKYAERVVATGFLAISRRFGFDPENYQHLTIQDTIDTVGQAFLGLTLGCARCHDHKFDPILRDDYYALYGIFDSTTYAFPGSEKDKRPMDMVPLIPAQEADKLTAEWMKTKASLTAEIKTLADAEKKLDAKAEPDQATKIKKTMADTKRRLDEVSQARPFEIAYAVRDGKPHHARIHKRGEPLELGDEVPRRFLEILGGDKMPADQAGSGRLALAHWLARAENPLTARVMVNRLWQHHFGTGLVATANDFGTRGQRPTHPELLDDLANLFQSEGWSIKAMHRLIMRSRVYQLANHADGQAVAADPDNQYLSRTSRRRLDAEAVRDAMLALGGNLDTTMAGPHPFPPIQQWGFTQHAPFTAQYDTNRRSVYLMTQRLKRHPYLSLFDGPDTNASTPFRTPTTVPTQSLFLMNDPFVHQQANAFASRIRKTRSEEVDRIDLAYSLALARSPSPEETKDVVVFLADYRTSLANGKMPNDQVDNLAWAAFARTLFARNEFLFVD